MLVIILSHHTAVKLWLATRCRLCGEINIFKPTDYNVPSLDQLVENNCLPRRDKASRNWGSSISSVSAGWLAVSDRILAALYVSSYRPDRRPEQGRDCDAASQHHSHARPSRGDGVYGRRPAEAPGVLEQARWETLGYDVLTFNIRSKSKWGADTWLGDDKGRWL